MPSGPKNARAAWSVSALRPVVLPTGMKALVKLPDVSELVENDALPKDLQAIAAKYASTGVTLEELAGDAAGMRRFVALTYMLVAKALKYLATADSQAWDKFQIEGGDPVDEGWQPISITGGELREMDVDPTDIQAIASIVGRRATPNEITAMSRYDHGLLDAAAVDKIMADEAAGGRVSDVAAFRRQPERPERGAGGKDVRPAAVGTARPKRPRRGVRAGRGSRP